MNKIPSYRQMIKERPGEYEALCRLMDLEPERLYRVLSTAAAYLLSLVQTGKQEEVFQLFSLAVLDKYRRYKEAPEDLASLDKKETCVVCEKEFLSNGSGEVPVCMWCLVGVKRGEART